MLYASHYESPVGICCIFSDEEKLTGLYFADHVTLPPNAEICANRPIGLAIEWLKRYFRKEKPDLEELPMRLDGTGFFRSVWAILKKIPYGETITYGEIARILARPGAPSAMAARAVGRAVGRNPISIIVPCHRVIGANGKLTGYAGGLDKKIFLLEHEGIHLYSKNSHPKNAVFAKRTI